MKLLLFFLLIFSCSAQAQWSPPPDIEPYEVLKQARSDTKNGKYALALEKHVWFFSNALSFNRNLAGVRLSFALGDWKELGDIYPQLKRK